MTKFEWIILSLIGLYVLYRLLRFWLIVYWDMQDEREAQAMAERISKVVGVPPDIIRRQARANARRR